MKAISICLILSILSPLCLGTYIGLANASQVPCTTAYMVDLINKLRTNYTWAMNFVNEKYPVDRYPQSPLTASSNYTLYMVQTLRITIETLVLNNSLSLMQSFDAHNAFAGMQAHRNAYYLYTTHFGCCKQPILERLYPFGLNAPWAEGIWVGIDPFTCERALLDMLMSDLGHRGPYFDNHPYVGIGFGARKYDATRDTIWVVFAWYDAKIERVNHTYVNQPSVQNWLNHYVQGVSCPADQSWVGLNGIENPNPCVNLQADPVFLSDGTCYGAFHANLNTIAANLRTTLNTTATLNTLVGLKNMYPTIWGSADPATIALQNLTAMPLNLTLSQFACRYAKARMTNTALPALLENIIVFDVVGLAANSTQDLQTLALLQGGKFFLNYQSYGYGVYYNSTTAIVVGVLYTTNPNNVNPPIPSPSAAKQPVYRFYSPTTKQHYLTLNGNTVNAASFGFPICEKIAFYTLVENFAGSSNLSRIHQRNVWAASYPYGATQERKNMYLLNALYPYDYEADLGYVFTAPILGTKPLSLYEHPVKTGFPSYEWFILTDPASEGLATTYQDKGVLAYVYGAGSSPVPSASSYSRQAVYRFYSNVTKQHYFSLNSSVANAASLGFPIFEKIAFYTLVDERPCTSPLARLHQRNVWAASYPYAASKNVLDSLVQSTKGFDFEANLGYISHSSLPGTVPLYFYEHPVKTGFPHYEWFMVTNPASEGLATTYVQKGIFAYVFPDGVTATA